MAILAWISLILISVSIGIGLGQSTVERYDAGLAGSSSGTWSGRSIMAESIGLYTHRSGRNRKACLMTSSLIRSKNGLNWVTLRSWRSISGWYCRARATPEVLLIGWRVPSADAGTPVISCIA